MLAIKQKLLCAREIGASPRDVPASGSLAGSGEVNRNLFGRPRLQLKPDCHEANCECR
jgi:hypothetical protein